MTSFLFIEIVDEEKVVVEQKVSVLPDRLFADCPAKNMFYQYSTNTVTAFFLYE